MSDLYSPLIFFVMKQAERQSRHWQGSYIGRPLLPYSARSANNGVTEEGVTEESLPLLTTPLQKGSAKRLPLARSKSDDGSLSFFPFLFRRCGSTHGLDKYVWSGVIQPWKWFVFCFFSFHFACSFFIFYLFVCLLGNLKRFPLAWAARADHCVLRKAIVVSFSCLFLFCCI